MHETSLRFAVPASMAKAYIPVLTLPGRVTLSVKQCVEPQAFRVRRGFAEIFVAYVTLPKAIGTATSDGSG